MPTMNEWPSSQICMDCKYGKFVMGEDIPASTYTCEINVDLGPCASSCGEIEPKEEKEERFLANDPIEW